MDFPKPVRWFAILVAALTWFALLLQFYLSVRTSIARGQTGLQGVVMYFSFFTVLTNIIVALVVTIPFLVPSSQLGKFCASIDTIAGVAVNIALVSITYNLLLRGVWNPQGLQLLGDILLHDVVPILFVVFAWQYARYAGAATFAARARWALWPIIYFAFAMMRGALSGFYPYPFINATVLGYSGVMINSIGIVITYFAIAAILLGIDRIGSPQSLHSDRSFGSP
jgi:hypothetical protein